MDLANLRTIKNELMNRDKYVVTEQAILIILDRKSDLCMANNGKNIKHIAKRMHLLEMAKITICKKQYGLKEV